MNRATVQERSANFLQQVGEELLRCGRKRADVTVIAVSKSRSLDEIHAVHNAGYSHFGESRVQEAEPKIEAMPPSVEWHLIGSLQKNKVKKAVALFDWIHSVDSIDLAERIDRESAALSKKINIFLQVNASQEASKQGLASEDVATVYAALKNLKYLNIKGLMTMAPLTDDEAPIRAAFRELKRLADALGLPCLSMGMTNDWQIALQEGATHLRIGTALFRS